jgi:hypothetical protein
LSCPHRFTGSIQKEEQTMDIGLISAAVATILTPFLPILTNMVKAGTETIAQKGGEAAFNKAQTLWDKVKPHFAKDEDVYDAAKMLARHLEDKSRQTTFETVLATSLENNPKLAEELLKLIGGPKAVQKVLIEARSRGTGIHQEMVGANGEQNVHVTGNSEGTDLTQSIKNH